ncbi:MAG: nickel pincer cofactor biosynthesis protein LarB [Candidatus Omnitrophica bacterium]|nr:nickel pincer cofactor biosynthesis protein LarB [Candidatus Omnitrophota bacterium]
MNLTAKAIEKILRGVESRRLSSKRAFDRLKNLPYETFPFARIDHHRALRKGFPEAVYAPGKTIPHLEKIIHSIRKSGQNLIVTRLDEKTYRSLRKKFKDLRYSKEAKIAYLSQNLRQFQILASQKNGEIPSIAVITGGTSDLPVAEEAALTLELTGRRAVRLYDCGVAGLHRLLDQLPKLRQVKAIICVAGMEGALPSVVAGLSDKPVIAVPTSVGYGASFKGVAPLLTMLNSCAQGVAVVNIDNGFGAACFAVSITSNR